METCAAIFHDWVDATPWMPRVHEADDVICYYRENLFPHHTVLVAVKSDTGILGFAVLSADNFVSALYLSASIRGQGIGGRLLDHLKTLRRTLSLWTFVANQRAQIFYQRAGFTEVRRTEGDNEENLPDILYRWRALRMVGEA